ncbi:hypothetical protein SERLADRAFT_442156 [Serpula lacrymans var. lacrymans S7.9]|nr:uncharacterized protein SERLADRAFT_442156 [Serpula lacrymans var. lacrymans S7.9]EGO20800.1 hypothetical protein SERLADRAFT_442156 [Serpula lacrymans var. lacrymans S7.9]
MDRNEGTVNPPEAVRIQNQRSSVPSFLFIIFMLFMLTNHSGDEFLARNHYQDALQSLNYQMSNFTAWMNGTESNFTLSAPDSSVAPLLQSFMTFGSQLDPSHSSYFPNVTGFIRGDVNYHNVTPPSLSHPNTSDLAWASLARTYMADPNMTEVLQKIGPWNWSGSEKISWSLMARTPVEVTAANNASARIAMIHGRIDLVDPKNVGDMRLDFEGVHIIGNGSIYGFAEPIGRNIDIRLLPSIVPEGYQNATAHAVEPEIASRINKLKTMIDQGIIDQDSNNDDNSGKSKCGFTLYSQIEPSQVPEQLMDELEEELQRPTGKWTVKSPKLTLNGVLLSKECGILYHINNTEGLRSRTFFRKVTTYAGTAALAYFVLLVLLSRQMDRSRTPAGISRLSRWSFLTQAIVDAVSFAGHITFAILADGRPSLSLVAPAFLACMLFAYEAQFSILINQVQAPEDVVPAPSPIRQTPPSPQEDSSLPTQAPQAAPPTPSVPSEPSFFRLFMQHLRSDPQARIWLGMFFFLTFVVRVIVTPSLALFFVGTMYSSFWLPQIVRSVRRSRSSALSKEYLVGTTICRLYFALYFLACPKNVLDVDRRPWIYILAVFILMQVIVLILQEQLGPTFFLPKRFTSTKMYDYHPPIPSSGVSDPESPDSSLGDCAICMEVIYAEDPRQRQQVAGGLLHKVSARRNYSLAPCSHLFVGASMILIPTYTFNNSFDNDLQKHTECLEKWLAIKNICPQCRRPLPPL